jgi:hypothetical protein
MLIITFKIKELEKETNFSSIKVGTTYEWKYWVGIIRGFV